MPKWGIEMSEGTIAEWRGAENEPVAKCALLTLVETDKITNEIEAEGEGRCVRIVAEAGGTFPVGALLAVRTDGEEASADEIDAFVAGFRPADISFAPEGEETGEPPATEPSPAPPATPRPETNIPEGVAISPVARARVAESGVDVAGITDRKSTRLNSSH